MNNNYWYRKNVFITGINGFIGGNLAKLLVQKGANVFGLIRNHSEKSFLYFEDIAKDTVNIMGDILDKELMCRIISEENINVVFHLAAQVEVGVGMLNPYLTLETNIRGTYTRFWKRYDRIWIQLKQRCLLQQTKHMALIIETRCPIKRIIP